MCSNDGAPTSAVASLGDEALVAWIDELERRRRAIDADRAIAAAELERRGSHMADGHLSLAAWLADRHALPRSESERVARVGRALERLPRAAEAMSRGEVSLSTIDAVVRAGADVPDALARDAGDLLSRAATLTHRELIAELAGWRSRVDGTSVRRDEDRRFARRRLAVFVTDDGMVRTDGDLDPENGQYVITALRSKVDAWARSGEPDPRTPAQRRTDALGEICREWLDLAERPTIGGERPHIVVTVDLETLERRIGAARLDDAGAISVETARRLACDAEITRVVLGPRSEPLDVGRRSKVVPPSMRRAVIVRDGGCAAPGCERPPGWCDAHHVRHWADGGETAATNLVLLCRPHHRFVHAGRLSVEIVDGRAAFRRPDGTELELRGPPVAA